MATIEEIAKTHIIRSFTDMNDFQAGYFIGATEMLDKAVMWLNDNKVRDDIVGYFLDTQREEMREEFILEFKKEMEE